MFDDFEEEEIMDKIQHYIDIGAIRVAGFTEDGEAIFELNENTTRELAPELWEAHEQYIDAELLELLDNDLMQVEYDEDLNATFNFTLEGYEIAKSRGIIPLDTIEDFDL